MKINKIQQIRRFCPQYFLLLHQPRFPTSFSPYQSHFSPPYPPKYCPGSVYSSTGPSCQILSWNLDHTCCRLIAVSYRSVPWITFPPWAGSFRGCLEVSLRKEAPSAFSFKFTGTGSSSFEGVGFRLHPVMNELALRSCLESRRFGWWYRWSQRTHWCSCPFVVTRKECRLEWLSWLWPWLTKTFNWVSWAYCQRCHWLSFKKWWCIIWFWQWSGQTFLLITFWPFQTGLAWRNHRRTTGGGFGRSQCDRTLRRQRGPWWRLLFRMREFIIVKAMVWMCQNYSKTNNFSLSIIEDGKNTKKNKKRC